MQPYPSVRQKPTNPTRRATYGEPYGNPFDQDDDYDAAAPPPPPPRTISPTVLRRKPVGGSLHGQSSNNGSNPPPPPPRPGNQYASQTVGSTPRSRYNTAPHDVSYGWPEEPTPSVSGYTEGRGTLVYPSNFVYESPPPPPPRPKGNRTSYQGSDYADPYPIDGDYDDIPASVNETYRPLPPHPEHPPYSPKIQVSSPYELQFSPSPTYPGDRFHMQQFEESANEYPESAGRMRRSPSSENIANHLDMPSPVVDPLMSDVLHPLPSTPKSPYGIVQSPNEERRNGIGRQESGRRPGTTSSNSSQYSYTQDRPIEHDYPSYFPSEDPALPTKYRSDSFGRSNTILHLQRPMSNLRVDPDVPPVPPPLPPHVELTPVSPPLSAPPIPLGPTPPIYRSRTDPSHTRTLSTTSDIAPPPPPKIPLDPESGHFRQSSLGGVGRSQSHSAVLKSLPRAPGSNVGQDGHLLVPDEASFSPITDSKNFPLSSKQYAQCQEPWAMSSLRNWILDVLGPHVTMESISHALRGLFTHHVSTLSTQQADKLAAQVGTTWVREGVLFEPTVANTALWNPLSTLEMSFTPQTWEGVIPTLTGRGCYSYACPSAPPGLGRCYSHTCSRTLVKKNRMSQPAPASAAPPGGSDWVSFWNLDDDFLRNLDKREIKRQNNILELIKGEEEYVGDLATMLNFQKQLVLACSGPTPVLQPQRVDAFIQRVFGAVKPLLDWNGKALMAPLRERQTGEGPVIPGVGDIVLKWVRGCSKVYADYSGGYPFADNMVREEESSNPNFKAWLEKALQDPACRRLPFNSFLQRPNQRIQKVLITFAEIIKNTEETNRDREILQPALDELKVIVHECDARTAEASDNLARMELDEKLIFKPNSKVDLGLKDPNRKVLHRGDVSRKSDKGLEWLDIHLILLDNFLIMTKRRRERGQERLEVSKHAIPLDLLQLEGVTDDAVIKTRGVGTMTTVVPQAPISRRMSSKPLTKTPTVNGANQTRTSPDYTITTPTDKLIYPFSVTHLASNGDTYTLYTESAQGRSAWVDKILEAKIERAALNAKIEPFQARIIAESVFGNPTTFEQLTQKPPALVALSTMHRALTALREGPIGSRTLGRAITHARVNCAKSFIAPESTDYAHQRLVAVGTEDGVYIGYMPESSGLCTTWTKVLSLPQTTQIDVMDEFGVFLVLANKELIAYSLSSIVPQLPLDRGSVAYSLPQRQPQRLSGSHSVGFFATGKLKDRMLVIYKKKSGVTSIFKAMEPVVGKADLNRRNLFSRKKTQTEFFRDYDDFFIATDCFNLFTFKNTIAIPTTKGFEVLSLDSKDAPQTIPDLADPKMQYMRTRLEGTKALGMFRISADEFLLCYDECAIYVDKHGEVCRAKVINWHGKPKAVQVIGGKYVLAFDTSFIEIWRCDGEFQDGGVMLVQIIPGRDVRMIGKEEEREDLGLGPATGYYDKAYVAMGHPERTDRQIVLELSTRKF